MNTFFIMKNKKEVSTTHVSSGNISSVREYT